MSAEIRRLFRVMIQAIADIFQSLVLLWVSISIYRIDYSMRIFKKRLLELKEKEMSDGKQQKGS